jgi:hypothetical protein
MASCQKLGSDLKIDVIKKSNNKKCAPEFVFFNEKIWTIFDIEN